MKLIIQIPCYNEEGTLKTTFDAIPKHIEGVDCIEILIINDGSTDKTVDVAKEIGVNHIISHNKNLGLARAFDTGLKACVNFGADIIVNLDADNQYKASDIPKLIEPIINKQADIVIGARPIDTIKSFSPLKKVLQKTGSWVMKLVSGADIEDAPSGFRAFSRAAAIRMNVFDTYTYTMETIIQAQRKGLVVKSVNIGVNEQLRPSRLVKNNFNYIKRSVYTMLRSIIIYRPFRFFIRVSYLILILAFLLGLRFVVYYLSGKGQGHIQSLILCTILTVVGVQSLFFAVIADLLAINRKLLEDIQVKIREKF